MPSPRCNLSGMNRDRTYAVVWREGERPPRAGKLEVGAGRLKLEAGAPKGRLTVETVFYSDVRGVELARRETAEERPALLLDRDARPLLRISSVDGPGTLRELHESLTQATAGGTTG
jgi:hypothetical protein